MPTVYFQGHFIRKYVNFVYFLRTHGTAWLLFDELIREGGRKGGKKRFAQVLIIFKKNIALNHIQIK